MTIAVILSKLQKTSRHTFDLVTLFSQNGHVVGNTNRTTRFIDSKWTFWPNASDMNKWVCPIQPPKWSRPRNDPQPWNDPQIDPEIILALKWSPLFLLSTPKWSPRNYGMVIKHGTVDCSIIRESKDILAYVVNRFTAPILTTKRE